MKNDKTTNAQVAETNQQVAQVPDLQQAFEQRKEYFREKERKVKLLEALEENIDTLQCVRHENEQREENSNMFSEPNAPQRFILEQISEHGRSENVFKVTNPALIDEILYLLISKMQHKAESIKTDILA